MARGSSVCVGFCVVLCIALPAFCVLSLFCRFLLPIVFLGASQLKRQKVLFSFDYSSRQKVCRGDHDDGRLSGGQIDDSIKCSVFLIVIRQFLVHS